MDVIIVDDDSLICKSLTITLSKESDIVVLGTASDGNEALMLIEKKRPDIILMDIRMKGMDGIVATKLIKEKFHSIKIIMLTTFQDKKNIQLALQNGADGYLLKTDKIASIATNLRMIMNGISVMDNSVLKSLSSPNSDVVEVLTQREQDVIRLVAQGLTNKEIGKQLFLSEGTIRNNVAIIMEKLNVKNRTQLTVVYYGKF